MTMDMEKWEMGWEPKCWGEVQHVFTADEVAVSVLRVNGGFRCSRHYHEHRDNQFDVISGEIEVWEWHDSAHVTAGPYSPLYKTNLVAGQSVRIVANKPHMFRVLKSGIVVEIYTAFDGPVDIDDIIRFDEGGRYGMS